MCGSVCVCVGVNVCGCCGRHESYIRLTIDLFTISKRMHDVILIKYQATSRSVVDLSPIYWHFTTAAM